MIEFFIDQRMKIDAFLDLWFELRISSVPLYFLFSRTLYYTPILSDDSTFVNFPRRKFIAPESEKYVLTETLVASASQLVVLLLILQMKQKLQSLKKQVLKLQERTIY